MPRHLEYEPVAVRYDMPEEEVSGAVGVFLENNPELPHGRLVGIKVESDDPMSNVARWLECRVFDEAFQNGPDYMQNLYGGVEQDSTWFLVLDRKAKTPVGVMRVVDGDSARNMTLEEAPDYIQMPPHEGDPVHFIRNLHDIQDDHRLWDAATMAIAPEYRGRVMSSVAVAGILQRMFIREALDRGVDKVLTMLDVKAHATLKMVGIPFEAICGSQDAFPYAGSAATLAMIGNIKDFQPSVAEKYKELSRESFVGNIIHMGMKRALRRRIAGKVAGMAALGKNVDNRIMLEAPPVP